MRVNTYCSIMEKCFIDNINVSELCRYCGFSRQTWYNIVNNKTNVSLYYALLIADYLNTPLENIFEVV